MTKLLSPHEAAAQLQANPADAAAILARLDIEACRFVPTVDSAGKTPLVETGMAGFGQPASGFLAFTGAEVAELHKAGKKAILVSNGHSYNRAGDRNTPTPNGDILTSTRSGPHPSWQNSHFLVASAYSFATLIDNPAHPAFKLDERTQSLQITGQAGLRAGTEVTLDPVAGKLWLGQHQILPPPDYITAISNALYVASNSPTHLSVAFHSAIAGDFVKLGRIPKDYRKNKKIGLYRTESSLREALCEKGTAEQDINMLRCGTIPDSLSYWEYSAFHADRNMTYRLVDIHGIIDLLPSEMAAEMAHTKELDTKSSVFALRTHLYQHQLRHAIGGWGRYLPHQRENPKTIIIPAVCTKREVLHFKQETQLQIKELVPEELHHLVRFGVMIETAEAVANIAQIAPLCDTLCFGTNDLTAAFTKLSRRQLDHSAWMRERGYPGRSPFEVLVPEVSGPMAEAIQTARAVNPAVQINVCGYQIGGHDLPSQLAVLKMGVDCLTIPPTANSVLRTQAAIIRHKAGLAPV